MIFHDVKTTIFYDINCPFCFVFNEWLNMLGLESVVYWQGIEHMPEINDTNKSSGQMQDILVEELESLSKKLSDMKIRRPPFRPNSRMALAVLERIRNEVPVAFIEAKRKIFRGLWLEGLDISNVDVLKELIAGIADINFDDFESEIKSVAMNSFEWKKEYDRIPIAVSTTGAEYSGLGDLGSLRSFLNSGLLGMNSSGVCRVKSSKSMSFLKREDRVGLSYLPLLRKMFEHTTGLIFLLKNRKETLVCNRGVLDFFNRPHEEIINTPIHRLLGLEEAFLDSYDFKNDKDQGKVEVRIGDSKVIPMEMNLKLFKEDDEEYLVVLLNDISYRLKMENEIRNVTKMAFVGEVASGIIHEISNPLQLVNLVSFKLKKLVKGEEEHSKEDLVEACRLLEETTERVTKIIGGLSNFFQSKKEDQYEQVTLYEIIDSSLVYFNAKFKGSGIKFDIDDNVDPREKILCNDIQITQVLVNLLNNAHYYARETSEPWIKLKIRKENNKIMILVTDSGDGIPQHIADKIFENSYTTKPRGKGTGFGLSISKWIIENHGGNLYLNMDCKNTQFVVELPCFREVKEGLAA